MTQVTRFPADRATYFRAHLRMAAVFMGGAMGVLWLIDSPYIWAGGFAALAAVTVRGWFLRSEELSICWRIEDGVLAGPGNIRISLGDIVGIRALGSFVQIVTKRGEKHLIKYQADPSATISAINRFRE